MSDVKSVKLSTMVFTKNGKKYVPFIRMFGELDEPLLKRKYIFFSAYPSVRECFTLKKISQILEDSPGVELDGIWLIDSISTAVITISRYELKKFLNEGRKRNESKGRIR